MKRQFTEQEIRNMPRSTRRYWRLRGVDVPKLKPGPNPGFKQSREHIAKRKMFAERNPNWKGDAICAKAGRTRALRKFKQIGPCVLCGSKRSERHHIDGDTANNETSNIIILCRRCHMREDGRLEQFRKLGIANQPKAVAARWR